MTACDNCGDSRLSKGLGDQPLGGPIYRRVGKGRFLCDPCYHDFIGSLYDKWDGVVP